MCERISYYQSTFPMLHFSLKTWHLLFRYFKTNTFLNKNIYSSSRPMLVQSLLTATCKWDFSSYFTKAHWDESRIFGSFEVPPLRPSGGPSRGTPIGPSRGPKFSISDQCPRFILYSSGSRLWVFSGFYQPSKKTYFRQVFNFKESFTEIEQFSTPID